VKSTITFYDVECDVERYQYFLLEDGVRPRGLVSDGRPWTDIWEPPRVFSFQPRLREGDFWRIGLGGECFAVRPETLGQTSVAIFLQPAGEFLPLPYEGRQFQVLNITECIDALDRERTAWDFYEDLDLSDLDPLDRKHIEELDTPPAVRSPVFRLDRLGWQLFKVPETAMTNIYYWERNLDGEEEQFRRYCERHELTGLVFTEIYSTESPW